MLAIRKPWKSIIDVFDYPTVVWRLVSKEPPRIYPHKPYIARNYSHCATSLSLIAWVYLHSNFRGGLRKTHVFWNVVHNGLQGHPRSLILAPIRSAYAISYWLMVINSNLRPILPCFRGIAGFLLGAATPPLFYPNFGGIPLGRLGLDCRCCGSEERRP